MDGTSPAIEDTLGDFMLHNPGADQRQRYFISRDKTSNPVYERWHRRWIHLSRKSSRFRMTVGTVLVVHGWETEEKKQPMSLIVLGVRLNCHASGVRIQSARMWFTFHEDDEASPPNAEEAGSEVVAFAPFVEQEVTNANSENREEANYLRGYFGLEQIISTGLEASRGPTSAYTRQHFHRRTADCIVRDDKGCGVDWFCEQNKLTNPIPTSLSFSSATTPGRTTKPISFSDVFDMRIEAGSVYGLNDNICRAFRLGRPGAERIHYDPRKDPYERRFRGVRVEATSQH
ncbi:hypothetical protein N657DRAFT_446924 [Parathielavia appendiculata]|uniref:Uncharacterized protein n=1 Tax=Parathielavia appendiculata TaxID=2587402 RepID=A0AAN6TZD8_9PEZI|nr:hypothetical protein N657DRAFT_446924 [Parathielavia appendiculata]